MQKKTDMQKSHKYVLYTARARVRLQGFSGYVK